MHDGALPREKKGYRTSDSAAASRDDGGLVLKSEHDG
jgi:hypothetical protein